MNCPVTLLAIIPFLLGGWAWLEKRRVRQLLWKQVENDRLRIRLERLETVLSINDDIDSLSDDELIERMRNSPYRRD